MTIYCSCVREGVDALCQRGRYGRWFGEERRQGVCVQLSRTIAKECVCENGKGQEEWSQPTNTALIPNDSDRRSDGEKVLRGHHLPREGHMQIYIMVLLTYC